MESKPFFPMGSDQEHVYNEEGVDLSLIRWMLSLSLEERLQALQDHANSLLMMRHEITIT